MAHHQRPLWAQSSISFDEATKNIAEALTTTFQTKELPTKCLSAAEADCGAFSISVVHFRCWDEKAAAATPCHWYFHRWDAAERDFNYLFDIIWDPSEFSKNQVRRLRQKLSKAFGSELTGLGNA